MLGVSFGSVGTEMLAIGASLAARDLVYAVTGLEATWLMWQTFIPV